MHNTPISDHRIAVHKQSYSTVPIMESEVRTDLNSPSFLKFF